MTGFSAATRALLASLLVAVALSAPAASATLRADGDVSYDNPRYDASATLAVEGTIETVVIDQFGEHAGAEYQYGVRTGDGDLIGLPAAFAEDVPNGGEFDGELALTGALADDIRAEGVEVEPGETIDADSRAGQTAVEVAAEQEAPVPVASATVTEPAEAVVVPGEHHAYVAVMNNMPNSSAVSLTQIKSEITAAADYWDAQAGDAITSFQVAEPVAYASAVATQQTCGLQSSQLEAVWNEAAAEFAAVDFSEDGNHLIVVVPESCPGAAGWGNVGDSINDGGRSIITIGAGNLGTQVATHEVGHNFGLGHANLEYCPASCSVLEYYNVYSIMGFAFTGVTATPPALDTANRRRLLVTDDGEVDDVVLVGGARTEATRDLAPRSATSGLRGLRVIDPATSVSYFVDFRSGTGADSGTVYGPGRAFNESFGQILYKPGVTITQYVPSTGERDTKLLSRKSGSQYLTSLASGESYTSPSGRVKITAGPLDAVAPVTVTLTPALQSAAPTISGSVRVGKTVAAVPGTWPEGPEFTYQWRANGVPIEGATGPTFSIRSVFRAAQLSVVVTGTKSGFLSVTRTSAAHTVAAGTLTTSIPTVKGTQKVGYKLTAIPGTWGPSGVKLTYRWFANGSPISNATKSTYTVTKGKKGKYVTVRVSGVRYGYASTSRMSIRTTRIR